jgi:hypothetical protein
MMDKWIICHPWDLFIQHFLLILGVHEGLPNFLRHSQCSQIFKTVRFLQHKILSTQTWLIVVWSVSIVSLRANSLIVLWRLELVQYLIRRNRQYKIRPPLKFDLHHSLQIEKIPVSSRLFLPLPKKITFHPNRQETSP